MTTACLDGETYSEAGHAWDEAAQKWRAPAGSRDKGLSTVGAAAYSEHPSTEILTVSYDLVDQRGMRRWRPGQPLPDDLFRHVLNGGPLESHNAMFERLWWMNVAVPKHGWSPLPPNVQRCSMATARTQCLPGSLDALGDVLQLDTRKDAEGKRLLRKFSIPRDPTKKDPRRRIRPEDDPEDFERLCVYCDNDVRTEQAASARMVPMSAAELAFWQIDQEVNWRGIAIDRAGVRDCMAVLDACMEQYGAECREMTGGIRQGGIVVGGIGPSQVQALVGWIAGRMHGPAFVARPQYDADLDDDVPF